MYCNKILNNINLLKIKSKLYIFLLLYTNNNPCVMTAIFIFIETKYVFFIAFQAKHSFFLNYLFKIIYVIICQK